MLQEDLGDLYHIQNRGLSLDRLKSLWLGVDRLDNEASVDTIGVLEGDNFDKVHGDVSLLVSGNFLGRVCFD
jgi:hypothetical protein